MEVVALSERNDLKVVDEYESKIDSLDHDAALASQLMIDNQRSTPQEPFSDYPSPFMMPNSTPSWSGRDGFRSPTAFGTITKPQPGCKDRWEREKIRN